MLSTLDADQQREMVKYMRFFSDKREETLASIAGDFEDAADDLRTPPFSMEDVRTTLDRLQVCVKDGVRQDLKRMLSMNVLVLKQLLEESKFDVSTIENEALILEAEKIRLEAPIAEPKSFQKSVLRSLKDEQRDLVNAKQVLEDSNKTLQQRFSQLQQQLAAVLRENSQVRGENTQLKAQLDLKAQIAQSKDETDIATLRRTLSQTRDELAQANENLDAKVDTSRQFLQLKKILNDKNTQLLALRRRLANYEPDTLVPEE
ncbi:hypothetical protein CTAYLR_005419 [Chrysophaeum taylorii]|uniref:Leucine zipper transcription factor-like protein 1 n=1 Tax=Chrysophaeum taylorii TaxID=2483200 RepID=A0AAD7XHL1_9STRA|nr:hypothetical protein CTAYLR_005419 [Chrysophaeum taylorii]